MALFYGCRDPGTKLDGVKLAPVTAKTSKTGRPRRAPRSDRAGRRVLRDDERLLLAAQARKFRVVTPIDGRAAAYYIDVRAATKEKRMKLRWMRSR